MWPTWRSVLAQVGYFDSSFLGCTTDRAGNFVVVFSSGPDAPVGVDCAAALNDPSLLNCEIEQESQAIDLSRGDFGAMYRIECP
jgi:hypothetical protein